MEKDWKNDHENYYKMSEPYESADKANEALREFYKDVETARKKHKIPDLLIITKGSTVYEGGKIGSFMQHSQYGNQLNGVAMAAYAYGQLQAEERELINKLLAGTKK